MEIYAFISAPFCPQVSLVENVSETAKDGRLFPTKQGTFGVAIGSFRRKQVEENVLLQVRRRVTR